MKRRVNDELLDRALREPEAAQHELEDLLRISRALTDAFETEPRAGAVRRGRQAALAAYHAAGERTVPAERMVSPWEWLPQLRVRALGTAAILIGILGALIAGGHGSLPGDALYGVKLGVEQVRLAAAIDSIDQAKVHLDIAAARIDEIVTAKEQGRTDAMRESLRRYTEAIQAVEVQLASGDLSSTEARVVLAEAAGTLAVHEDLLTDLRPDTPANAKPELDTAIHALEDLELPPPPPSTTQETPTPGPTTTPEPTVSPVESPTPDPSSTPAPDPSESPAPEETTPVPTESPADEGSAAEGEDGTTDEAAEPPPVTDGADSAPGDETATDDAAPGTDAQLS